MDHPYLLATGSQKAATILYVFLRYLGLLFFPYPLTYDYSFRQIPYRTLADPAVLTSLLIHLGLLTFVVIRWRKKDLVSWCILFYFATLLLVSNLFFNIGAPLAERFLYQASVPFVIGLSEILRRRLPVAGPALLPVKIALAVVVLSWLMLGGAWLMQRNQHWRNDETLFLHDVKISKNSARANTYAGIALIRLGDRSLSSEYKTETARQALNYFNTSLKIKNDYLPTLLNMGVAYSRLDSGEAAERTWNEARKLDPQNATLLSYNDYLFEFFYREGMNRGGNGNYPAAVVNLEKAVAYKPGNADGWYNLGGAYYTIKNYDGAKKAWLKALEINPQMEPAKQGLRALPPDQ
jgi:tetratricopeptide (TPR) repeat protein